MTKKEIITKYPQVLNKNLAKTKKIVKSFNEGVAGKKISKLTKP